MEIIRTLAVARSVGLQVLLVVVKDLAPLAVATVAAWAGDRHWVAYGLATLLLAAMTLFVFYTAVAVHSTVSAMRLAHNGLPFLVAAALPSPVGTNLSLMRSLGCADGLWTVLIRSARFQLHQLTACSGAVPACVWRGNADFETHPVQTRKGKCAPCRVLGYTPGFDWPSALSARCSWFTHHTLQVASGCVTAATLYSRHAAHSRSHPGIAAAWRLHNVSDRAQCQRHSRADPGLRGPGLHLRS